MISEPLFVIPEYARQDPSANIIAGGLSSGYFGVSPSGAFDQWSVEPEVVSQMVVPQNRFGLWSRIKGRSGFTSLDNSNFRERAHLFPCTWVDHCVEAPLQLESQWFSPVIPEHDRESSLPIQLVVFRIKNNSPSRVESALMLSWCCGWSDIDKDVAFDLQHDNLCLTGALGVTGSPNRQGIALPDLHSEGIYLQSVEPWASNVAKSEEEEIWADFAEDGELDPRVAKPNGQAAAAWVKFDIEPDEVKEIPFVIAWHYPLYQHGPFKDQTKYYTQFLGRYRPDNSIVWLAEQAFQNYGTEAATYKHWMRQIQDWHESLATHNNPAQCAKSVNSMTAIRQIAIYGNGYGDKQLGDITPEQRALLRSLSDQPINFFPAGK